MKNKLEPFTSTQAAQLYELLQPEIEMWLDQNRKDWTDLVQDPTHWTEQEAKETSVQLFYAAIRQQLLGDK